MAKVTLRRDTYLRLRGIKREFNLKSTNEALDMVVETAAKNLKEDPLKSDRVLTPEELKVRAAAAKKAQRAAKAKARATAGDGG